MAKATSRQIDTLKKFGFAAPPPTKAGCSTLLNFIISSKWRGMDQTFRIRYALATEKKWLDKHVLVDGSKHGTVDYIICAPKYELLHTIQEGRDERSSPFRFHVIGDDGKRLGIRSVVSLTLIEE